MRQNDRHYRPSRDWAPRDTPRHWSSDDRLSRYPKGDSYSDTTYYNEPEEPPAANGDMDVATDDSAWRVVLVRGLKTTVDENLLAKGLDKLYLDDSQQSPPPAMPLPTGMPTRQPMPVGATPQTLKRVFVIRDRVTEKSLGFGFAEYHSVSDAKAAVAKAKDLGSSCTISSKPIEVCHPHLGVFGPVLDQSRDEERYVFDFNGRSVKYHDKRYYASPQTINEEPPAPPKSSSPVKDDPPAKPKKRTKTEALGTLDNPAEQTKKVKKESEMVALLNRNQAQARGEDGEGETNETNPDPKSKPFSGTNLDSETGTGKEQSFAYDGKKNGKPFICCLLCGSSFQKRSGLEIHVQESPTHAQNYKDQNKFDKGLDRLKNHGISEDQTLKVEMKRNKGQQNEAGDESKPKATVYNDRAAKRREDEAKAKAAGAFKSVSLKDAARKSKGGNHQAPSTTTSESPQPSTPSMGIGRKMLQKAGWTEGEGLGSGNGITAPIEQNVYAAGVGLGHEGSKKGDAVEEAQRLTKSDQGDFVEKTRETARKRFEDMG